MGQNDKIRALQWSLYAILSVVLVEFVGGFLADSLALLSDASHASFDAITTFWLLYATRLSMKPPDANHTYGHEKIETLGGQLGGIALLGIAGLLFYYSVTRLLEGSTISKEFTLVAVLAVAYTLCIDVFRMKILSNVREHSPSARADFFHAVADFSSTIAALFGVAVSSLGFAAGDALSSIVLSVFLGSLSVRLVYKTSLELSDVSSEREYHVVQSVLESIEGVKGFRGLRMRRVGSKYYIDATILLSSSIDVERAHSIASMVEEKIRRSLGRATITIHCEPVKEELPFEEKIDRIALRNKNVRGVHSIISTKTEEGTFLTLHIETDPSLTLTEAHKISQNIEEGIGRSFPEIQGTTVHIESYSKADRGSVIREGEDSQKIRRILLSNPSIRKVTSIRIYESDRGKHADIVCSFVGSHSIEEVHREISKIEGEIKKSIGECTVTTHPEPV
jgi:cation diffusion facilitator family transporter